MAMLKKAGQCGTLESSDILVTVEPLDEGKGREIVLNSPVKKQFGKEIVKVVEAVLDRYEVNDVKMILEDSGALNPTIEARVEVALKRGLSI